MLRPIALLLFASATAVAQDRNGEIPVVRTRKMAEELPESTTRVVVVNPGTGTFEALKRLALLEDLETSGPMIEDAEVQLMAQCLALKRLRIHECPQVTDAGVSALVALKQLEALDVSMCTTLTDASLRPFSTMKSLRELSIYGCSGMTGAGVEKISSLMMLDVGWIERFDDRVLASLAALTSLEKLQVNFSSVTGKGFKALAGLKTLMNVSADDVPTLTIEGIGYLAAIPNLIEVSLSSEELTDEALVALSTGKGLERVYVYGEKLTVKGVEALATLPKLDAISITGIHVGLRGAKALARSRNLTWIDARDAGFGDKSLRELATLPSLAALYIEDNRRVTNAGIKELAACRTLEILQIGKSSTLTDLAPLVGLPELESLSVAWSAGVDDAVIAPLVDAPNLRVLDISSTSVTGAGLISLVALKPLRDLDVNFCPEISEKAHEVFRKARPDVNLRTTR
ncbi:MAG: hypothetical protein AAB074_19780 [Planctomycetota bacterium]